MVRRKAGKSKAKPEDAGGPYYKVESLLSVRETDEGKQYLVKWAGYDEEHNDWLYAADLNPETRVIAEKQFRNEGTSSGQAETIVLSGDEAKQQPADRSTRAKNRQVTATATRGDDDNDIEVVNQMESNTDDDEDFSNGKKKKKKKKSHKGKKDRKKETTTGTRHRSRNQVIDPDDDAECLRLPDVAIKMPIRQITAREMDSLEQQMEQNDVHLSDLSESSNIPVAVLEIEETVLEDGIVPLETSSPSKYQAPDAVCEETVSCREKSLSPKKVPALIPEPIEALVPETIHAATEESVACSSQSSQVKEYSPSKVQELQPLIVPNEEVVMDRLASRSNVPRNKKEISSSFLELKRMREEARMKSIIKSNAQDETTTKPDDIPVVRKDESKGSSVQEKMRTKEKGKHVQNRVARKSSFREDDDSDYDEDDDWNSSSSSKKRGLSRPPSKIPKPAISHPVRKDRRSMVIIPAKGMTPQPQKVDVKPELKKFIGFTAPSKLSSSFKIPKRTSSGSDAKQPDWNSDWKHSTGAQNWGATSSASKPNPNEYNNNPQPPQQTGDSYAILLQRKPQKPRAVTNFGYKPQWAMDPSEKAQTLTSGASGDGWSTDTPVVVPPNTGTTDDGWNDEPSTTSAAGGGGTNGSNAAANGSGDKMDGSGWGQESTPAAPPVHAVPVDDDDGWN